MTKKNTRFFCVIMKIILGLAQQGLGKVKKVILVNGNFSNLQVGLGDY